MINLAKEYDKAIQKYKDLLLKLYEKEDVDRYINLYGPTFFEFQKYYYLKEMSGDGK